MRRRLLLVPVLVAVALVFNVAVLRATFTALCGTGTACAYVAGDRFGFQTVELIRTNFNDLDTRLTAIGTTAISWADGVKQTFNPNGTNAGVNVGSHAGDPGSPANGDLWYDSGANELTARINGANVALGAGGGGSPGGSSGDLQINDGAGGFDPYAGDGCSPGDFVTDIAADGAVTCDTPAGGGGGLVLLESHTASSSATLEFTTRNAPGQSGATFQSDYDDYIIKIVSLIPASDGQALVLRVSTNGGSSYDSGSNYYSAQYTFHEGSSTATGLGASTTQIVLIGTAANTATLSMNGSLELFAPGAGNWKAVHGEATARVSAGDGHVVQWIINGHYQSATAIDAFQVRMTSGNLASGTIRVYGVEK